MSRSRPIRIGVIADTHGLFDPAILQHFQHVDHIVHAGDIGKSTVIDRLKGIAPVTAISGNVDGHDESGFPSQAMIVLAGVRIAVRHILYERGKMTTEGQAFLDRTKPDICIFGHTHQPTNEWLGETLLFNPGSAGPKRFTLPRMLGMITIGARLSVRHIRLKDRII